MLPRKDIAFRGTSVISYYDGLPLSRYSAEN